MIKKQILAFVARWVFSSVGMWISITLFATVRGETIWWMYVLAGLIFSLLNAIIRPIVTTFALPLILLTMGLFTIIINTAMVFLTIRFLSNVSLDFWGAILSSLVLSIANGVVNFWSSPYNKR
ncbi:phage holin family protein [Candidatus Saccharibacteria bacterium]|nr:phage holin family protein [Candidatus Saccharibacteria bacterium]